MYVYLKSEGNRKKVAAMATSGVKGHCQHPSIHDDIIDVDCQISGDEHATLDVTVTDSKTLPTQDLHTHAVMSLLICAHAKLLK